VVVLEAAAVQVRVLEGQAHQAKDTQVEQQLDQVLVEAEVQVL
jgi:hypothetical protein